MKRKRLGTMIHQYSFLFHPDMYGHDDSVVRTRLTIVLTESNSTQFLLKLRIPGWTNPAATVVKLNSVNAKCLSDKPGHISDAFGKSALDSGTNATDRTAFYCVLGPNWQNGSTGTRPVVGDADGVVGVSDQTHSWLGVTGHGCLIGQQSLLLPHSILCAVEASFPMLATTQAIQDVRPENANLRAIRVGPFVMAGEWGSRSSCLYYHC